jgi:hypothetical protein
LYIVQGRSQEEASAVSIVVRLSPVSLTAEKYDKSWEALEKVPGWVWPPPGLDYHVCFFGSDGHVLVSQIWDTREQFEAFGEVLIPALAEAGIELSGPPVIFEAHEIRKP